MTRMTLLNLTLTTLMLTALSGCGEREDIVVIEVASAAHYDWPTPQAREDDHDGLVWDVPAGWVATDDVSEALIADYRFPGMTQDLPGRMTVSRIAGDGGGLDANLNRWREQFFFDIMLDQRLPQLERVSPVLPFAYGTLQIVELNGDYRAPTAPTAMIAAIFTFTDQQGRPFATWFFKLTGDRQTIARARETFSMTILSFRREGDEKIDLNALTPGDAAEPPVDPAAPTPGASENTPPLLSQPEGESP